jgi:hypothetical protein
MNSAESSFWSTILTSLGTASLVGFLFWSWINNKFKSLEDRDRESRSRIRELEKQANQTLTKDDHFDIRKEDKENLEKQINEIKADLKGMPEKIVNMLKPFLNNK